MRPESIEVGAKYRHKGYPGALYMGVGMPDSGNKRANYYCKTLVIIETKSHTLGRLICTPEDFEKFVRESSHETRRGLEDFWDGFYKVVD